MIEITKWGNSQGIRIPKKYLKQLGLKVGNKVELRIENGNLIIIPMREKKKPKIDINELFKGYIKTEEYNWGKVGKEIW